MAEVLGLREKKAIMTKMALVDSLSERIAETPFRDIRVEDLCGDAHISRVTFHKYFPVKENLLEFMASIWAFKAQVGIRQQGLKGRSGLDYIIDTCASGHSNIQRIYSALQVYYAEMNEIRRTTGLTEAEKQFLYPDDPEAQALPYLSIGQLIQENVLIAIEKGEVHWHASPDELNSIIGALLNGSNFIAKRLPGARFDNILRMNYRNFMQCIQKKPD